jgi:tripartite-type tricarboxylate transporter receptor subunit TctC
MPAKSIAVILIALAGFAATRATAQTYPTKPIRIVVGFVPGGPADVMARLLSPKMSAGLGQPVVVDNRGGAGGTIAARAVAEAEPDGHTLLLGNTSTLVISPLIYRNINYDPLKGFAPIARIGVTANILVVNPGLPAKSVRELIAYGKANLGKLNYSSPGIGTPPHLIGEMFKLRAGLDVQHIPYKGGGPSIQAVIAGETQYTFENSAISLPLVEAGTLRALAVTSETRIAHAPDLPTMIEAGVPGFASVSFTGVVGPAGMPAPVVARLNLVINEALRSPEVQDVLRKQAVEVKSETAAAFGAFLAQEMARMTPVVRAAGIVGE